MIALEELK